MTNSDKNSVEFESDLRKWQLRQWRLIDDLEGGTEAMVAHSNLWLPKFKNEKDETYELRRCLAELEPVYSDTLDRLASKPFSQPITFENTEGLDDRLIRLEENIDGEGTDVSSWSRGVFREAIHRGVTFVLVDLPDVDLDRVDESEKVEGGLSAAGEDRLMLPRFVHISPRDVIGWREIKEGPENARVLDQVRIRELRVEPKGDYGDETIEYIRVIDRKGFEIWRRMKSRAEVEDATRTGLGRDETTSSGGSTSSGAYELESEGTHSFGRVPLFPFFTRKARSSAMVGLPALQPLADANLGHFKALSTHNVLMEHARRNVLFMKGFDKDEVSSVVWSQSTSLVTHNDKADVKMVSYQGSAHEASFSDLERRERRMRSLGASPMDPKSKTTATEILADESGTTTNIQSWAVRFGRYLEELIAQADRSIGGTGDLPEDFRAKVFTDFSVEIEAASDMKFIETARGEREITQPTFLNEMKRRGILSDGVDVEVEVRDTEKEQEKEVALAGEAFGDEFGEGVPPGDGNPPDNPKPRRRQTQEA